MLFRVIRIIMPIFPFSKVVYLLDFSLWWSFRFHRVFFPNYLFSFWSISFWSSSILVEILIPKIVTLSRSRKSASSRRFQMLSYWIMQVSFEQLHLKLLLLWDWRFMIWLDHVSITFEFLKSGQLFFFSFLKFFFLLNVLFFHNCRELRFKFLVIVTFSVILICFNPLLSSFQSLFLNLFVYLFSVIQ